MNPPLTHTLSIWLTLSICLILSIWLTLSICLVQE
jgi:hypothetical protein